MVNKLEPRFFATHIPSINQVPEAKKNQVRQAISWYSKERWVYSASAKRATNSAFKSPELILVDDTDDLVVGLALFERVSDSRVMVRDICCDLVSRHKIIAPIVGKLTGVRQGDLGFTQVDIMRRLDETTTAALGSWGFEPMPISGYMHLDKIMDATDA